MVFFHQRKTFSELYLLFLCLLVSGFPGGSEVKGSASNAGDPGSIPGSGRFPGEGNGNPLQYSFLLTYQRNPREDSKRLRNLVPGLAFTKLYSSKNLWTVAVSGASLVAQTIKNLPAMQETWVRFLGREDSLEKETATQSSISLANSKISNSLDRAVL